MSQVVVEISRWLTDGQILMGHYNEDDQQIMNSTSMIKQSTPDITSTDTTRFRYNEAILQGPILKYSCINLCGQYLWYNEISL